MTYREINFDGLVGPTHNYAGLSHGNTASARNRAALSNPRQAALQGLLKAMALAGRGFPQAVLPPHERPSIAALREWGFSGPDDTAVLSRAARDAPQLLAAASSASAMWTANACTMAPSCDTRDGRAHFSPANLLSNLHRAIEAPFTERLLRTLFADPARFAVHPPLPGGAVMADEGAANHTRLAAAPGAPGLHLFVHGCVALDPAAPRPARFPARQTLESCQALARRHRIAAEQVVFLQQAPAAIDAGVFHNDVISVGHGSALLFHERAFLDTADAVAEVARRFRSISVSGAGLRLLRVAEARVGLAEAVRTYLFNSQLLARPDGRLLLVCPAECRASPAVGALLDEWLADPANPLAEVLSFDLRESMRNGGGPACLRQRVVLNDPEFAAIQGRVMLDQALHDELADWIRRHYREQLAPGDLADPALLDESRRALDELTRILRLPPLYPFQLQNS
jgi:succinylarginine dihydrolase